MAGRRRALTGGIVSLVVAAITITVFGVLRDYGPESAIRKFHEAVAKHDPQELLRVSTQGLDSYAEQWLVGRVEDNLRRGAWYRVARMDRRPGLVVAEIDYVSPDGTEEQSVWTVVLVEKRWLVDAEQTGAFRRILRRRPF